MVGLLLVFLKEIPYYFLVASPIYISVNSERGFLCFLSAFLICRLFNEGLSEWCEVIPHCSFDLHFSDN